MSEKIDHFLNRMVKWNRGSSLSGSTLLKHLPSFLLFPVFQRWSWDDQSSSSQSFIKKSAGKLVEIPGVAIADLCNQISKPLPWVNKTGYRLHLCTFWIYRSFSPPLIFFSHFQWDISVLHRDCKILRILAVFPLCFNISRPKGVKTEGRVHQTWISLSRLQQKVLGLNT